MSRGTIKSMSDKKHDSDDSDSSIDSISSCSSWKIEPKVEKCKTTQSSPKVISFSDSSSDCSDETYEAKVVSYLSGISIQENTKTEEQASSKPKKVVDNASSSSWESDSSMEPSFRYSSKTLAKKKIWETLERAMEEDHEMRRIKKLKKKRKPPSSPEKVPNEVYVDAGLRRNLTLQQIQISHLAKRNQNNGHILEGINSNPDIKPAFSDNDLERANKDLETFISEWFCEICNANFETKSLLNSHMVNKHEGFVNFLCQNCAHPFYEATHYNTHYQEEHTDKTALVFCYLCKKQEFPSFETLLEHLQTEHVTPDLYQVVCVVCSEGFISHEVLTRHYCEKLKKCHKNLIPRFIDKQNKIKVEENTPIKHQHLSASMNVLDCEYCRSVFHQSKYLRQHLAVHHRVLDVFECYICRKIFGAKYRLVEHFKRVHSGISFTCETCGKCFQTRFTLSTHMKKHTGDFDVFTCVECNQVFKRKQLIVEHVGDMNRKCLWCDKILNCRTKLLEHIDEKHRSLGRLQCTECRRDVHSLTKFWNHLIIYHPEQCRLVNKNCVICEKCRQLCSSRHHLKKHQRKVCLFSEKHVCKYCNIRFATNYLSAVHLKKVLRCALCGKMFECLTLLKEHVYFGHKGCGGEREGSDWEKSRSICCRGEHKSPECRVNCREKDRSRDRLPSFERSKGICQNEGEIYEKQLKGSGRSLGNCQNKGEKQVKRVTGYERSIENCQNKGQNRQKRLSGCGRSVEKFKNNNKNLENHLLGCKTSIDNCHEVRSSEQNISDCETSMEDCQRSDRKLSNCKGFTENSDKSVEKEKESMKNRHKNGLELSERKIFGRVSPSLRSYRRNLVNTDFDNLEKKDETLLGKNGVRKYGAIANRSEENSNETVLENSNLSENSRIHCDGTTKYHVPHSNQMSKRSPNCRDKTTRCNVSNNEKLSEPSKIVKCDEKNSNEKILKNVETDSIGSLKSSSSPKSVQSCEESSRTLQSCEETSRISTSTCDAVSDESNDDSSIRDSCSLISNNYTRDLDCDSVNSRNVLENSIYSSAKLYKYKCYDCDDSYYKNFNDLECHRRLAHDDSDDDIMICDHCGKQFSKRSILEGHFRKNSCSICVSKFGCWSLLRSHCTSQHKSGEWVCDKCNRRFRTSLTLVKHAINCIGIVEKKSGSKRKFVENSKLVKHPKYKRIRMLEDENGDLCSTDVPTSRISPKNTGTFRIVLKKRQKKLSPSYFNGKLRKSPRKSVSELVKSPRKTTPEKTGNIFLKSMRKTNDLTPVKSCNENDSKFIDRNCETTPGEDSSIEDHVSKSFIKNCEFSSKNVNANEYNVLRSVRKNCVSSSSEKKFKFRNGAWKSKTKLDDSSPKKDITSIEGLKFVRKLDEESSKNNWLESNNYFESVRKLNNVSPKNNVFCNVDMKPSDDSTLETSTDLIIDTSVSYCHSDNNDSITNNEEIKCLSDGILVETNTDKNPAEVTRTDFFLNLDLVSSTPIIGRKKVNGDFLSKKGFDEKVNEIMKGDDVLKNKNKFCRQLNMGENLDISKIVNFEDSPKRMLTSILKGVSSVKVKSSCKRIVHFEDDVDKNLSWKFCKPLSPDLDISRSVNGIVEAKNDSSISSSSKSQTPEQCTNRSQIYRCRLCKKRFTSKDVLQAHVSSNVCMVKLSNLT